MPSGVVIFSPMPPAKSGIADYTLELLPALSKIRPVVVVCERPAAQSAGDWLTMSPHDHERAPALQAWPHIYQIGNNADHVFAYRAFQKHPGILVQHDFNLHYLVEDATLAAGDAAGYRKVLCEEYGQAGATLADLRQLGLFSEAQKLAMPLTGHLLPLATGLIVHSQWVFERLPMGMHERAVVVRHHFAPQVTDYDGLSREAARAQLGLPADSFIVLSLGYITPPKQVQATLAALAMLAQRGANFVFVIGGERNPGFDIDAQVRLHGLQDHVRITGYLDEAAFFTHIAAADTLVNLRYPSVGESSGTLSRALAMGLPAVVHNFGPLSEFPDGVVVKVPLELGRPVALAAVLEGLMLDPGWRARVGQAARRHMRSRCSVEQSAASYSHFVDSLYGGGAAPLDRPAGPRLAAA